MSLPFSQSKNKKERYEKIQTVGSGTFGDVYSARDTVTGETVAVKKLKIGDREEIGVNIETIREIKVLQEIHHQNIIKIEDIFIHKANIYVVYEYCIGDMEKIINAKNFILNPADIKAYMFMLLQGIEYCHKRWILHRDLKPSNLLIKQIETKGENGIKKDLCLKIADFGLAKVYGSPEKKYSPQSVTRWYRPPELLFGSRLYGPSVDIWSVGCIFAELMLRTPLFPGNDDLQQISMIIECLGTPTEAHWPEMKSLPNYLEFFPEVAATPFKDLFSGASEDAIDLISKMLVFDPAKRITATDALKHSYFTNLPKPTPSSYLSIPSSLIDNQQKPPKYSQNSQEKTEEHGSEKTKRKLSFDDMDE